MDMQELEIMIDAEGKVSIKIKGVKGSGCMELTKAMEEALGTTEERIYTEEYYESPLSLYEEERLKIK